MNILRQTTKEMWDEMRTKCYNTGYAFYHLVGGKGIKICDEWYRYDLFHEWCVKNEVGENTTIDRIDKTKNYCPDNVVQKRAIGVG